MLHGACVTKVLIAVAISCLSCTSVVTRTVAPMQPSATGTPSASVPTATADPTRQPSASLRPSPQPSAQPTATLPPPASSPGSPASPASSPSPSGPQVGTFLEVILDDMSRPRSGFQTGDFEHHRVAYEGDELVVEIKGPGRSTWTMREFGDWPLVDIEAQIQPPDPAADGFYGLTCGRSNEDFYAGLLDASGGAVLLRIDGGEATVLRREEAPVPEVAGPGPLDLRLSCSGTDAGPVPGLSLSVGDRVVASAADPNGFVSFLRGGFYLESGSAAEAALMLGDDFRVTVGLVAGDVAYPSPTPTADPAVEALLLHVPEALRDLCQRVDRPDLKAAVAIDCATADVPVATYLQYPDPAAMTADYRALVAAHSDATGSSCEREPSEGPYTVDGLAAGRLLCFLDDGAATFYWTDERVSILGHARSAAASFDDLYGWWLAAGPLP